MPTGTDPQALSAMPTVTDLEARSAMPIANPQARGAMRTALDPRARVPTRIVKGRADRATKARATGGHANMRGPATPINAAGPAPKSDRTAAPQPDARRRVWDGVIHRAATRSRHAP